MNMNLTKTNLLKASLAFAFVCLMLPATFGQGLIINNRLSDVETMSAIERSQVLSATVLNNPTNVAPNAMWDIEYDYSISDSIPGGATGATLSVGFNGTDYWMAQWTDSLFHRFNASGQFIESFAISDGAGGEIGGTLGISWDGSHFYLSNGTTTIFKVDPTTKMLVSTFTVPAGTFITCYDPTLDNGNGGLWTNGWGASNGGQEPLIAVDFSGNQLASIPYSDHNLFAALGIAYDATSVGGPYIWGFDQSGDGATIKQVSLPTGVATPITRDVNVDFGVSGAGLSGGLYIADNHPNFPGQRILGGAIQNFNSFGYDLDFSPLQIDANMAFSLPRPGYSFVPLEHVTATDYAAVVIGQGASPITTVNVDLTIETGGASVFTDQATIAPLNPNDTVVAITGPWTPADTGVYNIDINTTTGAQMDQDNTNNDDSYFLFVNDSVFGRDNGLVAGALSVPGASNALALLGQNYTLAQTDFMTSISFFLRTPPVGIPVSASVYAVDGNGMPTSEIETTVSYTTTADDNANGVFLTLPFPTNPVGLPAGEFYVGVNQFGDGLSLATTNSIFNPGETWITWDALGGWNNAENLGGFEVAFVVRPNFGVCAPLYLTAAVTVDDDDSGAGDAILTATPTGGNAPYTYLWNDPFASTTQTINNVVGGQAYSVTVTDVNGCTQTFTSDVVNVWTTGIEEEEAVGINAFNIFPNPNNGQFDLDLGFEQAEAANIRVYDITGAVVETVALPRAQKVSHTFDLSARAAGIYLIQVQTTQGTATRRVSVR